MAEIALVGGGHNGLVCAYYLARAGHKVTIFEQSLIVGGACRNELWHSGAIVSPGANHFGMLNRKIATDMNLWARGLSIVRADPQLVVGLGEGQSLCLFDDTNQTKEQLAYYDPKDAASVDVFFADISKVRSVIQKHIFDLNPSLDAFVGDLEALEQGLSTRFVTNSIKATLAHYFRSTQARALFSATSFLYNSPPDEPGTAFTLAYLSLFETGGIPGWGIPVGGMGRVAELMAECAREVGVNIILDKRVEQIVVNNHVAVGIRCANDDVVPYDFVVSNADPYTTYVSLAGQQASLLDAWNDRRFSGPCAKFNFTFEGSPTPTFIHRNHSRLLRRSAYVYLPSVEFADAAFHSAADSGYSAHTYFEFVSPSEFDRGLAPPKINIGSIYALFANYDVICRWSQSTRLARKREVFFDLTSRLNIKHVLETELLDPVDIEGKFGMYKGNVDHGSPIHGNTFESRNIESRFGISNLVICGSGSHPGGLVSGVPGFNAAQKVLLQLA